jgi:hypothetical protein
MCERADYRLRWPVALFRMETAALVNDQDRLNDWSGRCELLLEDAFVGGVPKDDFLATSEQTSFGSRAADDRKAFLVNLLRRADRLPEATVRQPYWSERRKGTVPGRIPVGVVTREFVHLVNDLELRGYLEHTFGKECVDAPSDVDRADVFETELGIPDLWPLTAHRLAKNKDIFYDVIEVVHDLVARPRTRSLHSYAGCGWHHGDFSIDAGRVLYRWQVNRLLARSDLALRLAEDGEDAGRLIAGTDDARAELSHAMAARTDEGTGDRVRHALALFRARGATEHDKRSAAVVLAGVLEERRRLLKKELLSKDEGALFAIANQFAIRHHRDDQRPNYDPIFLDWVFWWYLATVELTDRLIARLGTAG